MEAPTNKDIDEFREAIEDHVVEDALQCFNNRCTTERLQDPEMYYGLDSDLNWVEGDKWTLQVKYDKDGYGDRRLRELERELQESFYRSEEWKSLARRFKRDLAEIVEKHVKEVVAPRFADVMMDEILIPENLENDYVKITKKD